MNFYRWHTVWFTLVPLIASGVFYASNGQNKIAYVDCLFMTVSPMTMTGLETVLMASLTTWQQVLMFLLMILGSTSSISIVMILIRLHYFKKRFKAASDRTHARRPPATSTEKWKKGGQDRLEMIRRVESPVQDPEMAPEPQAAGKEDTRSQRSQTDFSRGVQFEDEPSGPRYRHSSHDLHRPAYRRRSTLTSEARNFPRSNTLIEPRSAAGDFGGFPLNPFARLSSAVASRQMMMPRTTTLTSIHGATDHVGDKSVKLVNYLTFDAEVGRNSDFRGLTSEQEEELGGVEYRALSLLLKITIGYWFGMQLLAVLILAPWLSTSGRYKPTFNNPGTLVVNPVWFTFFQVFSAFSNDGLSLDDANMTDFGEAYLLQIVMGILILGGNTAYPIFLRILIWSLSKAVPATSRTHETLRFLLDHPRRCFIYLFPSYQTWFLAFVLAVLDCTDWVGFLVLDIGNPTIEAIPVHTRVINGLFQALSVRSGGFAIVNLSLIAPALQFLYVIMMYIG